MTLFFICTLCAPSRIFVLYLFTATINFFGSLMQTSIFFRWSKLSYLPLFFILYPNCLIYTTLFNFVFIFICFFFCSFFSFFTLLFLLLLFPFCMFAIKTKKIEKKHKKNVNLVKNFIATTSKGYLNSQNRCYQLLMQTW